MKVYCGGEFFCMKKSLSWWQTNGFIVTSISGVLLHFLLQWTNESIVVAWFSAVNESTWEHMKLLFFPSFVFALIQNRYIGREYTDFWCIKLIGILSGVVLIPVLYYTINGAFGMVPDWVNIAFFFVAVAFSYFIETYFFKRDCINCKSSTKSLMILWMIALIFIIFTFIPPQIPLFEDPVTKTYGYIN